MKYTILTLVIALLAAAPAFSATATAGTCSSPNAPATADAVFYEIPTIASQLGMSGTSIVRIDLDANGEVTSQHLFRSSGSDLLDQAALRSARLTRFTSEVRDCAHVPGSYLYAVDF